jgi:hypothetical protein
MRLEALADLLERLVPAVTAVTPEPAPGGDAEPHPVDEPVDDPRPTLDDFPAHVVESPVEVKPAGEEELFEDEEPQLKKPKPKKPARTKKSSTG